MTSLLDVPKGPGSVYSFASSRRRERTRPELHVAKHVVDSGIKHKKLLMTKNFASAELQLKTSTKASLLDDLGGYSRHNVTSPRRERTLHHHTSLPRLKQTNQSSQVLTEKRRTNMSSQGNLFTQSLSTFDINKNGILLFDEADKQSSATLKECSLNLKHVNCHTRARLHVTSAVLCDHLIQHGLGDPRLTLPTREPPPDPGPWIRKRRRQQRRVPYYEEKLKGRALRDVQTANSKAEAFIAQQRDANDVTMSTQWRSRFRHVYGGNAAHERDVKSDSYSLINFADWDEDKPRVVLDAQFKKRINTWIDDVMRARCK